MVGRLKQLLPASWKGIPFFIRSEMLTEGGRRIVLHDYPNSSERFVEDIGALPPKFSITAFVTGDDFIDRAGQLERALQEPGKGRLSMPTFGARSLFALPYKKDASQTNVGEIRFDLEFVAGRTVSGPSAAPKTTQTVYAQGDAAREQIATALEDVWITPTGTANVIASQYDLEQFTAAVDELSAVVNNNAAINKLTKSIGANSQQIVRTPSVLADTFIRGLWQSVSVGLSDGAGLSTLSAVTKFGSQLSLSLSDIKNASVPAGNNADSDVIPLWRPTTAGRAERNQNRLSLINAGRVASLVSAYEQAADATYSTDIEIEEARLALATEHQRLMRDDTEDKTLIQSQAAVRRTVENVRVSALDVLDQKEQSAYTLTDIDNITPISAFILSYNLYAEQITTIDDLTARGLEIRALNPTQPADKLSDSVTVLQS